jgi:hypothetical protein
MAERGGEELPGCWGRGGIGCVTFVAGAVSGGMIGVAISMIVAGVTKAQGCDGIPTCDWHVYMLAGAALGAVTLPLLTFWRLRRK